MRLNQAQLKFLKMYLKHVLLLLLLLLIYLNPVHELIHYLVCLIFGGSGVVTFLPAGVTCYNLTNAAAKFLQIMCPYFIDLIVIVSFIFISRKNLITKLLPHFAVLNSIGNFFISNLLRQNNDFVILAKETTTTLFWFGISIIILNILLWIRYFSKDLVVYFKSMFKKSKHRNK